MKPKDPKQTEVRVVKTKEAEVVHQVKPKIVSAGYAWADGGCGNRPRNAAIPSTGDRNTWNSPENARTEGQWVK